MPGGNRTGPRGMGPMTGRRAGYCAGYGMPGYMNPMPGYGGGYGRGFGRGFGGGRHGWRNRFYATGMPGWTGIGYPAGGFNPPYAGYGPVGVGPEHELETLREQASFMKQSLDEISKRIEELEAKSAKGDR